MTFEDMILSFIWFGIGFFIGCNLKYSIFVGDWKAHHGTINNPSDKELYTWHHYIEKKTKKKGI